MDHILYIKSKLEIQLDTLPAGKYPGIFGFNQQFFKFYTEDRDTFLAYMLRKAAEDSAYQHPPGSWPISKL